MQQAIDRRPAVSAIVAALPGLALCAVLAGLSLAAARGLGGPAVLYALVLGLAGHRFARGGVLRPGLDLAARTLLRLAVALLGVRITFGDMLALGPTPPVTVLVAVVLTLAFGIWAARRLGLPREFGALASVAVAICGVSAAVAAAAVLPRKAESVRDLALVVIGVTLLSTVAMVVYPWVAAGSGLDTAATGVFLGGSIHDVAQVVAAGRMVSEEATLVATYTKLLRVALLAPVILWLGWRVRRWTAETSGTSARLPRVPWFLVAFFALAALASTGFVPPVAAEALAEASHVLLVVAIAAIGLRTAPGALRAAGWRPLALLLVLTLWLGAVAFLVVAVA